MGDEGAVKKRKADRKVKLSFDDELNEVEEAAPTKRIGQVTVGRFEEESKRRRILENSLNAHAASASSAIGTVGLAGSSDDHSTVLGGRTVGLRCVSGSAELQGHRADMEDASLCVDDFLEGMSYYGVFDGHNGKRASEYAKTHLHNHLRRQLTSGVNASPPPLLEDSFVHKAIEQSVQKLETAYEGTQTPHPQDGSTAIVCLVHRKRGRVILHTANIGDSRAVLGRVHRHPSGSIGGGDEEVEAIRLSEDHKPNRPDEERRIVRAGGRVVQHPFERCSRLGVPPLEYYLGVSRALGDFMLKNQNRHALIADPEIDKRELDPSKDSFLILACDGVWDVLSDLEAVQSVHSTLRRLADQQKDKKPNHGNSNHTGKGNQDSRQDTHPSPDHNGHKEKEKEAEREDAASTSVNSTADGDVPASTNGAGAGAGDAPRVLASSSSSVSRQSGDTEPYAPSNTEGEGDGGAGGGPAAEVDVCSVAARTLVAEAMRAGTMDNCTAVVVKLYWDQDA